MSRFLTCIIVSLILMFAFQGAARSEKRLALLIGNQKYDDNVGALNYPHYDIETIRVSLKTLGFWVNVVKDADYKQMDTEVKDYVDKVSKAGPDALSFFYYSGHGAANPNQNNANYLIPVDVKTAKDQSLWKYSIRQDEIINRLREATNATHFVVFDACRNELNLPPAAEKGIGADKGFSGIQAMSGMLIAYATAPNKTAADNGQFATILAEELLREGMEVTQVFRNVQLKVKDYTRQDPLLSYVSIPKTYFTAAPEGPCNAVALSADGQKICRRPGDGQQFKDCEACPEMVVVPPGEVIFYGVSPIRQLFSFSDLRPAYKVRLAAVAVSRSPVTFDEWGACVAAGGCASYTPSDEGWGRHNHPVINVSWDDARTYLEWLSNRTGHAYRLLSEAKRKYLSDNNQGVPDVCRNCDSIVPLIIETIINPQGPMMAFSQVWVPNKRTYTFPVRDYGANEWGLYQVRGNVDEWVEDCWHVSYTGIPGDGAPWKTGNCESHTMVGERVGAGFFEYRWGTKRDARDPFTSFRVARALSP